MMAWEIAPEEELLLLIHTWRVPQWQPSLDPAETMTTKDVRSRFGAMGRFTFTILLF
jgi:hypothetical protein